MMNTTTSTQADCVVVGGGPGGMVLALLLARQGLKVRLLEARDNFDRDYRGDGVHPSTLALMDELGLLDRVLELARAIGRDFPTHLPDGSTIDGPRDRVPGRFPDTASVPQTAFLDLLADVARRYPWLHIQMGARVDELLEEDGVIRGVGYRTRSGRHEVHAPLVVGADGRFSKVRQLAGLTMLNTAQEVDLLWLRLPKAESDPKRAYGLYPRGQDLAVIGDRGDAWQIGLVVPKASYTALREAGIQALCDKVGAVVPWIANRTHHLRDWDETSLLVVQAGRVKQWYRPGLLLIGDAAHVMSPVFGVGINYAIQDAVVAANVLGPRLRDGGVRMRDLHAIQRRREWPMRLMQWFQEVEKHVEIAASPDPSMRLAAWLAKLPPMRKLRIRLIAFGGAFPERLRPTAWPAPAESAAFSRQVQIRMAAAAHRDQY